jgi:predicted P-loop ATPase
VVRVQDMYRVIESDFVPEFHPFRFYLEHLPPWDGQNHILAMSVSVSVKGDVEEQMLFAEYLTKWLVGMVAGWVDDSVVNNVILVLIGEQGSYKTTWFNYLLPPELSNYFYTKTNAQRMGRDDLLTLAQYGLVCCEELDTMRPSELNQLKAAVTMPSIDERAAYAHFHEHRKHIASFCGTGNNAQFLSDPTGNRRWLPFEVESIESPREHPFDYTGIYSQAYALYQQGFRFWFSRDEILRLQQHNSQFEAPKLEHELIDTYFRRPANGEFGEFMPVARAMQIVGGNIAQKLNVFALGRAFKDMGFEKVVRNHIRGYIVVQRSAEEIKTRQSMLGGNSVTDGTEIF